MTWLHSNLSHAAPWTLAEVAARKRRYRKMNRLPASIQDWPLIWKEAYQERAGIMQFQGNLGKEEAEKLAEQDVRKMAEGAR